MMNYPMSVLEPIKEYLNSKKDELTARKERLEQEELTDPAIKEEIERSLGDIERSLTRIDQGTYGNCIGCNGMINTDRLKIEPTAEYCVDCQRKKSTSS